RRERDHHADRLRGIGLGERRKRKRKHESGEQALHGVPPGLTGCSVAREGCVRISGRRTSSSCPRAGSERLVRDLARARVAEDRRERGDERGRVVEEAPRPLDIRFYPSYAAL